MEFSPDYLCNNLVKLYGMISILFGHLQPSITMKPYMFSEAFHAVIESEYVSHDGRHEQSTYIIKKLLSK